MAKEPWSDLVKARANLLNRLSDLSPAADGMALAQVRDAIDTLIQERLTYKPNMTAKILEFPVPIHAEAKGWICGCGGERWVLYANGDILCPRCNCISTVIKVVRQDPA